MQRSAALLRDVSFLQHLLHVTVRLPSRRRETEQAGFPLCCGYTKKICSRVLVGLSYLLYFENAVVEEH
jgi:hypothetical protein